MVETEIDTFWVSYPVYDEDKGGTSKMNIVDVGGIRLNYSDTGNGPEVVFVHGTSQDHRVWENQVGPISARYRTVCYSRRCALPNQNRDYTNSTVDNNAKDLEGLIINTGGGPVNIVGQSYGGAIAALCALRQPKLVRSLVLIEPFLPRVVVNPNSKAQMLYLLLTKPSIARSGLKAMKITEAMVQELGQKNDAKALKLLVDMTQNGQYPVESFPATIHALALENVNTAREIETPYPQFTKEDARRIAQPTLLITGEGSSKILKGIIEVLHRNIPNNQIVEIPKAAHFPHFENPKEFNAVVMKFLAEHGQ